MTCYQCTANVRGNAIMKGCPIVLLVVCTVANILNVVAHRPWMWDIYLAVPLGSLFGLVFGLMLSLPDIDEINNGTLCEFHYDEIFNPKRG